MHETGVAEAIVETLRKLQAERGRPIARAVLQIGELSSFTPEHLAEHFREAAEGTEVAGVALETQVRGVMVECGDCGAAMELSDDLEACGECGGRTLNLQAQDAIRLVSVE